jgi:hypothetical protein
MKSFNVLLRRGALVGALLFLTLTASLVSSLIVKDSTSIAHAGGGIEPARYSYLNVVPFSVPLLAFLFTRPWYLGRRRTGTDPQG